MDRHELSDPSRRRGTGIGCSLHGAHIASNHDGDETCANILLPHEYDVGSLDHGVGRFDRADQALCFDHPECFECHPRILRRGGKYSGARRLMRRNCNILQ